MRLKCYVLLWLFVINHFCTFGAGVYFLVILLLCTNHFLTQPANSCRRKSGCQYSGWCMRNINIYPD